MKKYLKIMALALILALTVAAFAACKGDSSGDTGAADANDDVAGETQTWGNVTVFVPEGYTLNGGDVFDENDPDKLTINGEGMDYFMFTANYSDDSVSSSIESTKSINEGCEDVEIKAGGTTWKGVAYNSGGIDCVQVYAPMGEGNVLISSACHAKDDPILLAVLGSVAVK